MRLGSTALAFALALALAAPSSAKGVVKLAVRPAEGPPGREATVAITAEDAAELGSAQFVLTYDSTALTPVDASADDLFPGALCRMHVDPLRGRVAIAIASSSPAKASGTLCTVKMMVLDSPGATTPLKLTNPEAWHFEKYHALAVTAADGAFTIGAAPPGPAPQHVALAALGLVFLLWLFFRGRKTDAPAPPAAPVPDAFCRKCGTARREGDRFCGGCGTALG